MSSFITKDSTKPVREGVDQFGMTGYWEKGAITFSYSRRYMYAMYTINLEHLDSRVVIFKGTELLAVISVFGVVNAHPMIAKAFSQDLFEIVSCDESLVEKEFGKDTKKYLKTVVSYIYSFSYESSTGRIFLPEHAISIRAESLDEFHKQYFFKADMFLSHYKQLSSITKLPPIDNNWVFEICMGDYDLRFGMGSTNDEILETDNAIEESKLNESVEFLSDSGSGTIASFFDENTWPSITSIKHKYAAYGTDTGHLFIFENSSLIYHEDGFGKIQTHLRMLSLIQNIYEQAVVRKLPKKVSAAMKSIMFAFNEHYTSSTSRCFIDEKTVAVRGSYNTVMKESFFKLQSFIKEYSIMSSKLNTKKIDKTWKLNIGDPDDMTGVIGNAETCADVKLHNTVNESKQMNEAVYGIYKSAIKKAIENNEEAKAGFELVQKLSKYGEAYIVGGAARDIVMGGEISDIDIATNVPEETIRTMFDTYDIGKNKTFGVAVVRYKGFDFEVAQFRKDVYSENSDMRRPDEIEIVSSFEEDAKRRDLTINGIGIDKDLNVIDHVGGIEDISARIIRTIGDPRQRFGEDYLRIMRAPRFAARFGYKIDKGTSDSITDYASVLGTEKVAKERISQEMMKAASDTGEVFARYIEKLKELGVLEFILPEIDITDKYNQAAEYHPEAPTVFGHIMAALRANKEKDPIINMAILLHDIGKPAAHKREGEKNKYVGHDEMGKAIAEEVCDRLRLSNQIKQAIVFSVVNHMKFHAILDMKKNKIFELMKDPNWPILIKVAKADSICRGRQKDLDEWQKVENRVKEMEKMYANNEQMAKIKEVVNGASVMRLRNIPGGPEVGRIIQSTIEWMVNNGVSPDEKEKIIEYIKTA